MTSAVGGVADISVIPVGVDEVVVSGAVTVIVVGAGAGVGLCVGSGVVDGVDDGEGVLVDEVEVVPEEDEGFVDVEDV